MEILSEEIKLLNIIGKHLVGEQDLCLAEGKGWAFFVHFCVNSNICCTNSSIITGI
jgi:hypothetical protein